jgi:hypothetical protein
MFIENFQIGFFLIHDKIQGILKRQSKEKIVLHISANNFITVTCNSTSLTI